MTPQKIMVFQQNGCGLSKIAGMEPDKAVARMGLETQFFCSADPSGWDPIYGKSPVHMAGRLHSAALGNALVSKGKSKERS